MAARVNYDRIATTFDARYAGGAYAEVLVAIRALFAKKQPRCMLEVGCGTGYWVSAVSDLTPFVCGIDYSFDMLRKAADKNSAGRFARATAMALPFRSASFDLILCVNAIHHFENLDRFVAEARRLLRPDGTLAVLGMDPRHGRDRWCVYDYFPETKAIDLKRYPSSGRVLDSMLKAGFDRVECGIACQFAANRRGRAVLDDPELKRNGCSQMALLTDAQYAAGISRIESVLRSAAPDNPPEFKVDIAFMMQSGTVSS